MFLFLVFITEWALLMVEMVAFKIFAVHFGSTIYIWGNVIGMVMIGSSMGYYLGGRIADKNPHEKILMMIVLITGVFILILPFFLSFILFSFNVFENFSFWAFFLGIFLCAIPALLVEMVPPFITRLINYKLSVTGLSVGKVYGFSAIGGIAGILTATFITIPFLGLRETLFIAGGVLVLAFFLKITIDKINQKKK